MTRLADLVPDPQNRRTHNPRNLGLVTEALKAVGAARSIVVDEDNLVLAGNGVVEAAAAAGITKVHVVDVDGSELVAVRRRGLTDEQKRALAIYDNRTAELAEWNPKQLQADQAAGLTLAPWFSAEELAAVVWGTPKPGKTDPDAVPERRATSIERGDLFTLGRHRLLCGDCTQEEDVGRLLGDERPALCLTDPPYGVGLDYGSVFDDTPEAVAALAARWLPIARARADVVVFSCGNWQPWLYPQPNWVLGWFYVSGRGRTVWGINCWQPFLCYGPDPSLARGAGPRPDAVHMNLAEPSHDLAHPCPKPIGIWHWLLQRLTFDAGATVLDCFAGAGTGMIAAEQLGRRCYAMELGPSYCQVIIDRWEAFTGQPAEKVGDARPQADTDSTETDSRESRQAPAEPRRAPAGPAQTQLPARARRERRPRRMAADDRPGD